MTVTYLRIPLILRVRVRGRLAWPLPLPRAQAWASQQGAGQREEETLASRLGPWRREGVATCQRGCWPGQGGSKGLLLVALRGEPQLRLCGMVGW